MTGYLLECKTCTLKPLRASGRVWTAPPVVGTVTRSSLAVSLIGCCDEEELNDVDRQLMSWFLFWFNVACSQCVFSSSSTLFIEFTSVLTADFGRRRVFVLPAAAAAAL